MDRPLVVTTGLAVLFLIGCEKEHCDVVKSDDMFVAVHHINFMKVFISDAQQTPGDARRLCAAFLHKSGPDVVLETLKP